MNYPFNEPIKLSYEIKSRVLSILKYIPYRDYFFRFLIQKFPKFIKHFLGEKVYITPRIVEHPLVFRILKLTKGRILDIGCCESKLIIELASLGYEAYGIDQKDYSLLHPNFHFIKADIMKMPFPDNFFDCITAISTIEHIGFGIYGDPIIEKGGDKKAITEMKRVLKKGGRMLITMPYGGLPWPKTSGWHNRCSWYNSHLLKELLNIENLKIEEKRYFIKEDGNWIPAPESKANKRSPDLCIVFLKILKR